MWNSHKSKWYPDNYPRGKLPPPPPVRVRVWVRVSFRAGVDFARGQLS